MSSEARDRGIVPGSVRPLAVASLSVLSRSATDSVAEPTMSWNRVVGSDFLPRDWPGRQARVPEGRAVGTDIFLIFVGRVVRGARVGRLVSR